MKLTQCMVGRRLLTFFSLLAVTAIAQAGSWSEEFIGGMDVHIYTPSTAPALNDRRALMISMHGCAQTHDDMKAGGNWQATADQYGMVIALPRAPGGGVGAYKCWDYYAGSTDGSQSRSNRHNDNLIALAQNLSSDSARNIDPDQVYLSGLSSGGGQAIVTGCLAPDVFAGLGINAAPAAGTSVSEISFIATTLAEARAQCEAWAGDNQIAFETQISSVIYGSTDSFVHKDYNAMNADMFAAIYGAAADSGTHVVAGDGTEWSYSKGGKELVSLVEVDGMGHAWPAGPGASGGGRFIDRAHVNYPEFLTAWLFGNNRRAAVNELPVINNMQLPVNAAMVLVSGVDSDSDGTVVAAVDGEGVTVSASRPVLFRAE